MKQFKNVGAGPVSAQKQNGITLIALIITIIIMLILVAVTINMAINGGLFEKAGKAVGDTQNAINREQELSNGRIEIDGKWYSSIDDYLAGNAETPTYANASKDGTTGILKENATYTSGEYTAVIPKGFKIVEGINGTTTIADGLVIQDAEGNEFVWIPVTFTVAEESEKDANGLYPEFLAVFYRSEWSNNARGTSLMDDTYYTEPSEIGYTTPTTESADYYEMMRSVQENKGFYIGRYEAGSVDSNGTPIARTNTANGTSKVVVKQDQYPYTYVEWGSRRWTDYTSDVTDYNGYNQGKGALYLSKHMYDGKDIGATSTLCYGIQWDAMIDFIKDSNHNVTSSTTWGNYEDNPWTITRTTAKYAILNTSTWSLDDWVAVTTAGKSKTSSDSILLTTGADESFAAKNIYDVAGNVLELTNESCSTSRSISRGGYYYGDDYASMRANAYPPYLRADGFGFRPSLYIN